MDNYKDGYYLAKTKQTKETMPVKVSKGEFFICGFTAPFKSTAFSEI